MVEGTRFELFAILVDQAERVRAEYPELFSYLRERDDLLRRITLRVPDPGDPEGWVGFDVQKKVVAPLTRIPPGLADLG